MPADSAYDIVLAGNGYQLARQEQLGRGGRAWQSQTVGSSIIRESPTETRYGNQSPTIEAPMVWDDTSKGYGDSRQVEEGRYHYAVNLDARFKGQIINGPKVTTLTGGGSANVNRFFEFDGKLFFIAGRYCKQIAADDTITLEKDFGSGKVALDAEVFSDKAYVGLGYSDAFWQRNVAGTWTQATALYFGYACTLQDRMWASTSAYQVKSVAANPMTGGDWSAAYAIGDPGTAITGMAGLNYLLSVGKSDGLHVLDADGLAPCLTPELRAYRWGSNCKAMRIWHGALWVPHLRGLMNYQDLGTNGFLITPADICQGMTAETPVKGIVTALAGDGTWLYAALWTTDGHTYIMAGRETKTADASNREMIWHPLIYLASSRCDAMHISGLWTNPRLFFGVGTDVAYISLPRYGDNPLMDSNCRFALTGNLYLPAHSWGAPTTTKVWKSIEIQAENLTAARYILVSYRIDGGSWVVAGTTNVSPKHVLALDAAGVAGNKIELALAFTTNSDAQPIKLRSVTVRGTERPALVEVISAIIRCSDNLPLRTGGRERRSGATILAELKALASANSATILKDIIGTSRRVMVIAPVQEQEPEQEGALPREVLATVQMAVFGVTPTSAAVPGTPFIWGSSSWGDGSWWTE